jgi:hypothetical protein
MQFPAEPSPSQQIFKTLLGFNRWHDFCPSEQVSGFLQLNIMHLNKIAAEICRFVAGLVLLALMAGPAGAATEQHFETLQIGTHLYTNVTVTSKTPQYAIILYNGGMETLRVAKLSPEEQERLGYSPKPLEKTEAAKNWAKQTMTTLQPEALKEIGTQMGQEMRSRGLDPALARSLSWKTLAAVFAVVLVIYLGFSWCCKLICEKTGKPGGVLVWLPILKLFPLLRAAGMSGWWFLAFCVPLLNIAAAVIWSLRIVAARGKNFVWAILLILPLFYPVAILYLAFSSGAAEPAEESKPKGPLGGLVFETG